MNRHAQPLLILALGAGFVLLFTSSKLPAADDAAPPVPDASQVETCDLSTAAANRLERLDGQRVRFHVVVNAPIDYFGDRDSCHVAVKGDADRGIVELPPGGKIDDQMTVEGVLHVVRHPARVVNGVPRRPFLEFVVQSAVRVGP